MALSLTCWTVTLSQVSSNCALRSSFVYPRGIMVKAMDYGIVESEFELQSRFYVHFRANTLGKGMNLFILPAMG